MSKKTDDFIANIAPLARREYLSRDKWVLPSVCIAQAALETGWGTSKLMLKANAFFGIKATRSWKGKVFNSRTSECYDGKTYVNITACFRAYDSLVDSVKDYYDLICKSPLYTKAVNEMDSTKAITAIKNGGYATSPTYVKKVTSIIKQYNLTKYDARSDIEDNVNEVTDIDIDKLAIDVINGKYGNGSVRKKRLGDLYKRVQARVNEILS